MRVWGIGAVLYSLIQYNTVQDIARLENLLQDRFQKGKMRDYICYEMLI